jgi:gluconate 2-dehydrogenase gamma chain
MRAIIALSEPVNPSRRRLLRAAGAGIAVTIPLRRVDAQPGPALQPSEFFSADEARFVEAAAARLIPVDELGPGALEAGVPRFIDRQLAGAYGAGARLYRAGPWRAGTPSQGYQLPHTPKELFRLALRAINADLAQKGGFDKLDPHAQDAYLDALSQGKVQLGAAGTSEFFDMLLALTMEGYLGDPAYGGNQGMAAWKMIGFPGAYSNYYEMVGRNVAFSVAPASLAEGGHLRHEKE